ncbi:MAG: hypothetical protein R3C68_08150 [Myxococcota bacterium]
MGKDHGRSDSENKEAFDPEDEEFILIEDEIDDYALVVGNRGNRQDHAFGVVDWRIDENSMPQIEYKSWMSLVFL